MKLKQSISTFDIFCIASGVMISSGIFILPGIAFAKTGPSVFLAYVLAGLAALLGVLSIIELSTAMPKSGGDYYFITRSFGPLPGLVAGLFSWFSLSFKTAFAIFGIAEILYTFTGYSLIQLAIAVTLFFIILNILGVDFATKFEVVIVVGLLAIMLLYILAGIPKVRIPQFTDFAPMGINSIFFTAGFVFVSFGGLLKIASLSEEVRNPKKSIPLGIIAAVVTVTLVYALLLIVLVGTSDPGRLVSSLTPVADSARTFLGRPGFIIITIAALLAFVSTANAGIMSASRYPVALSHDQLLPPVIGRTGQRRKTPFVAILITGALIIGSLFLELEALVKIASSTILFSYILTNIAVIIIRESHIQNYRPSFRVPLYPWIQILSIILFSVLLLEVGLAAIEAIIVIVIVGIVLFLLYGKQRYDKEYALLYLIERIVNRKLTSYNLEEELKEILHRRDNIVIDRFHQLVEQSTVLDLDEPMSSDELFAQTAASCSSAMQLESEDLVQLLQEREQESSTALTDFLAIPHIIVEQPNFFKMLIIRNRAGVRFSDRHPAVKAIFILFGSRDERQFHLQSLSAIAQITQNPNFEEKWLRAKNEQNLRDICLLSERRRDEQG